MRIIVPFGFYGSGNIGDEGTLAGFEALLESTGFRGVAWVGSQDPAHTAKVARSLWHFHPNRFDWRRTWAELRATHVVFAGGTPIMDGLGEWPLGEVARIMQRAVERQVPVACVGVGTETLTRESSRRLFQQQIAPVPERWTVRSQRDRDRLVEYGVSPSRVAVAADMAWLLHESSPDFGETELARLDIARDRPLVAFNANAERAVIDQSPHLLDELARFLDELIRRHDVRILLLAGETRNEETFEAGAHAGIVARMRHRDRVCAVPPLYYLPWQLMSLIDCCAASVSMRYHFCLFSALQGVPFLAVQRSDKVADLCWDCGWRYGLPSRSFSADAAVELFGEMYDDRDNLVAGLSRTVSQLRGSALHSADALPAPDHAVPATGSHLPA